MDTRSRSNRQVWQELSRVTCHAMGDGKPHTRAPAWDRDAPFAGRTPPSSQRQQCMLLAALLSLRAAALGWLSGDAQEGQG
jgi:ferric-dicitrate binding protein FerR (iron transport regulator)